MNNNNNNKELQEEVEYWKRKAYILANRYGQCKVHDEHKDGNFLNANMEEYLKAVECIDCDPLFKEKAEERQLEKKGKENE